MEQLRSIDPPWVEVMVCEAQPVLDDFVANLSGLCVRVLQGQRCTSKKDLLAEFAHALQFPGHFGRNWDALEDCITDMEWMAASGYVIVIRDADRVLIDSEKDFIVFVNIMDSAGKFWATPQSGEWARSGLPFHVVLVVFGEHNAQARNWGVPIVRL